MGPIWGRQDPGGPHVGNMNLAIWVYRPLNDGERARDSFAQSFSHIFTTRANWGGMVLVHLNKQIEVT